MARALKRGRDGGLESMRQKRRSGLTFFGPLVTLQDEELRSIFLRAEHLANSAGEFPAMIIA
eukprot:4573414-Pyramimonas_sp.AAC.1